MNDKPHIFPPSSEAIALERIKSETRWWGRYALLCKIAMAITVLIVVTFIALTNFYPI